MRKNLGILSLAAIFLAGILTPALAPAQPKPGCSDAEKSHQFDFWIGEWDVMAGGQKAGDNSIQPILGGCVLQENWMGSNGIGGSSFNFYNPSTGKWHQYWVWQNGTTLDATGAYEDGRMVLSGEGKNRQGEAVRNRITWHNNKDGTVRQVWEVSKDEGATWNTVFDGLYKKKG